MISRSSNTKSDGPMRDGEENGWHYVNRDRQTDRSTSLASLLLSHFRGVQSGECSSVPRMTKYPLPDWMVPAEF